ncbi:MAG: YraN family protein [Planctomycetes bacterium]|nr:YraN family protein [Planctomycetota bacterium]
MLGRLLSALHLGRAHSTPGASAESRPTPPETHNGKHADQADLHNKELGARGERTAAAHLKKRGCKILKRNYICRRGEIDIIALDGRTICFVEVKTRGPDPFLAPDRSVTSAKRRKIRAVARYYLRANNLMDHVCRFDIVSVILPEKGKPRIEVIRHAF